MVNSKLAVDVDWAVTEGGEMLIVKSPTLSVSGALSVTKPSVTETVKEYIPGTMLGLVVIVNASELVPPGGTGRLGGEKSVHNAVAGSPLHEA